jgi:TrmH family RNA methyltransferase
MFGVVVAVAAARPRPVTTRNALFQQWQSLLGNRTKRLRAGEFLVQGVRPITQAAAQGWEIRALLHDGRPGPSSWAMKLWNSTPAARFVVAPDLMQELGDKSEGVPELLAVVAMRSDDLARVPVAADLLAVAFDRPASPGNLGSLIRSADALGGSCVLVTGHAADPYDPQCVRATTGSFFSLPVLRIPSHREVCGWVDAQRADVPIAVIGADERGGMNLWDVDLTEPVLLVIGNEATGMTAAWRAACDVLVKIPIAGAASSLNAANAGSIILYEAARQRALQPGSPRTAR